MKKRFFFEINLEGAKERKLGLLSVDQIFGNKPEKRILGEVIDKEL